MSFWDLGDGTSAASGEKEFSAGGGDFEPLPKGTSVLCLVDSAEWKPGYQVSEEFVNLKVSVLKPDGYAGRVLFFKLWVDELDPGVKEKGKAETKRDKHKRMIMAIDANSKGRLAKLQARPTDEQLALALVGSQFVATLGLWESERDGQKSSGNWLMAARPKTAEVSEVPKKVAAQRKAAPVFDDDIDDDVPF